MGRLIYYLIWPLLWFVFPLTTRVRAMVVVDDQILMVRHWLGPGGWDLPGGGIKRGETAMQAAIRELHEELAIKLDVATATHATKLPVVYHKHGLLIRSNFVVFRLETAPATKISYELTKAAFISRSELGKNKDVTLAETYAKTMVQ